MRIRSYNCQYYVIEALIRRCFTVINPNSVGTLPEISLNLKAHLIENKKNNNKGIHSIHHIIKGNKLSDLDEKEEDEMNRKKVDESQTDNKSLEFTQSRSRVNNIERKKKDTKKKKKARDKGIGIYAPYHHKKAQQI